MAGNRILAVLALLIFIAGCAGKRINIDPSNPVYKPKSEFELNYGFFITRDERKVGYALEGCPKLSEPIRSFDEIDTLEEFSKFEKCFWDIRDTDPNTPQNEFKELVNGRIQDIKNEIFKADPNIPMTRFDRNGGLKGDLAHVYLFYGGPHYKEKLLEGRYNAELMVWYYFDPKGRPLFRFLFYNKFGDRGYRLFKNHSPIVTYEQLFDPLRSPLREISNSIMPTVKDLTYLWEELNFSDPTWVFRTALFEFSYFSDVSISKALDPPEPAALTAKRFKPIILGQPTIPEGTEIFANAYHSFIPAYLRMEAGPEQPTFLMLIILHKNIDWEKQGDIYVTSLNLRISFQNKKTLKLKEFFTGFKKEISQKEFDKRDEIGSLVVYPVYLKHWDGEKFTLTLEETLKQLEPGGYVVNMYLQHTLTKKYNTWREEVIVQ